MAECSACGCDIDGVPPSTAFLAGIAFRAQYTPDAMRERLCPQHQEALRRGADRAALVVPPHAKRGEG